MGEGEDKPYLCYMGFKNNTELFSQIILLVLSLLLIGDAFRKFYRMQGSHNKHVTFIYRLLFFWWVTYIACNSYGLLLYQLNKVDGQTYLGEKLSNLTSYYFIADWTNAFSIQWLLLYLPYQWAKQISLLFDNLLREKESDIEMVHTSNVYKGYQSKIYKTLRFYMTLRIAYLALPVIFLILDRSSQIFKLMITCLLLDCIVITVSLIYGMVSLKTTKQLRQQLDEQESKRTFNQYLVVIFANILRFIFDIKHVITQVFEDESYITECPSQQEYQCTVSITLLLLPCLLTHYLPVFIILRIYNLQEKPEQMCESLIISKTEEINRYVQPR